MLNDFPQKENIDSVHDLAQNREIVSDEEVGNSPLRLQPLEQVENLGLNRDVQGRDGLVTNQNSRLNGEGPRDS